MAKRRAAVLQTQSSAPKGAAQVVSTFTATTSAATPKGEAHEA